MNNIPAPHHGSHVQRTDIGQIAEGAIIGYFVASLWRSARHPVLGLFSLVLSVPVGFGGVLLGSLLIGPSGWNMLVGLVAAAFCWSIPWQYNVEEDRRALEHAMDLERTYRASYRNKLAEVATDGELQRIDPLWDVERSFADEAHWTELATRWREANPPRFPSQADAQANGLLCRCEPPAAHACLRESGVNLNLAASRLAAMPPTLKTWIKDRRAKDPELQRGRARSLRQALNGAPTDSWQSMRVSEAYDRLRRSGQHSGS